MSPVRPAQHPPVDPRFRRRWAEARREEGRRRLRIVAVLLGGVALVAGGFGLLHSPLFTVKNVVVVGNAHTPRAEVIAAAGLDGGHALMVNAGPAAAARAIEALPWVGTVSFTRHWPWTVQITVQERAPAAIVAAAGGPEVVDRTGRVLEVLGPHERRPLLPVVDGTRGAPPGWRVSAAPGTTGAELDDLLAAASVASPALAGRNLVLAYSRRLGLVAYAGATRTLVLLGDPSQMERKLAVLAELGRAVNLSGYSQVDLIVPERPALTPVPNSGNS